MQNSNCHIIITHDQFGHQTLNNENGYENAKVYSEYVKDEGVTKTIRETNKLITDKFTIGEFQPLDLQNPEIMSQIQKDGHLITINKPTGVVKNGIPMRHFDNLRSIKYYSRKTVMTFRNGSVRLSTNVISDKWYFFRLTGIR